MKILSASTTLTFNLGKYRCFGKNLKSYSLGGRIDRVRHFEIQVRRIRLMGRKTPFIRITKTTYINQGTEP